MDCLSIVCWGLGVLKPSETGICMIGLYHNNHGDVWMVSIAISASGLQNAVLQMYSATNNIESASAPKPAVGQAAAPAPDGQGVVSNVRSQQDALGTNMSTEVVDMKMARFLMEANTKAMQAADAAMGTIMDIVSSTGPPS